MAYKMAVGSTLKSFDVATKRIVKLALVSADFSFRSVGKVLFIAEQIASDSWLFHSLWPLITLYRQFNDRRVNVAILRGMGSRDASNVTSAFIILGELWQ
jgi:hypothetical protein